MTTHLLIGGGAASLSAAETIRKADERAEIVVVSAETDLFYSRPGLAYLLSDAIPERQLATRSRDDLRELALEVRTDRVIGLAPDQHVATLASGQTVRYDRALVATGSSALVPDFPGARADGVVNLDSLADARAIIDRCRGAKAAVVVGGGPTALELAEGLRARGLTVHYLMRGDRYWSSVLDPAESRAVVDALAEHGVIVHLRTKIARVIESGDGKVAGIETDTGETIACQIVAVAIGVTPNLGPARTAGLAIDRGILVNEYMQTSAPDVFAAGDVAQIVDPVTRASHMDVLWSTALRTGRAAGRAMAGIPKPYRRAPTLNVTQLGGVIVTVIGQVGPNPGASADDDLLTLARGDSEEWRDHPPAWTIEHRRDACRIRVVVDETRVRGAVIMGHPRASRALCRLIERGVDVTSLRPMFAQDPDAAIEALIALGDPHGRVA